jgi:hypothetical protein
MLRQLANAKASKSCSTPVWVANVGFMAGVSLISSAVEIVGIDAGFLLTVSVTILQLWLLAVAVTLRPVEAKTD